MPTGYTANLEGVTFPQFALRCARAFGALIDLRDDPLDIPLPDCIKPSDYSRKRLTLAFEALLEVESWNAPRVELEARAAYTQVLQRRETRLQESDATRKRYEAMIERVKGWTPPTTDHTGLKDFMLKQLEESIDFDCSYVSPTPEVHSGQEYKHQRLCKILEDIEYHAKSCREELVRSRERTEWLHELRRSLD